MIVAWDIKIGHVRPFVVLLLCVVLLGCARGSLAQEKVQWRIGRDFPKQLDAVVGVSWANNPLRPALVKLGTSQRVAVFLDRRVDPGRKVTFSLRDKPLGVVFATLANHQELGVAYVGPVVYFGPKDTARKLAALVEMRREEIRKLPQAARAGLVEKRSMSWTSPAEPRELIKAQGAAAGIRAWKIDDDIPHDLWPGCSLPPMDFAQRMSLLLAGFGKTFEIAPNGSAFRVVPIPKSLVVQREYTVPRSLGLTNEKLKELLPNSTFKLIGTRLSVSGPSEEHHRLASLLNSKKPRDNGKTPAKTEQRYNLTITNKPIGPVIEQLARGHLGLDPVFAESITAEQKKKLVSFKVTKADLDELLEAALQPAGFDYRLEGETLHIFLKN